MPQEKIVLGNVVSLISHPYFKGLSSVTISGDAQLLSPLMVVVEILDELRDEYDEQTGEPKTLKNRYKCKCKWYSHKTHKFEEEWLSSDILKIIEDPNVIDKDRLRTKQVILKTFTLELGKKKGSFSAEFSGSSDQRKNTVTALLSFVPPIMHVVEVKRNDVREPLYDKKTGSKKKLIPEYIVKCKWFNPSSDKFSEEYFPLESLEIIGENDQTALIKISTDILIPEYYSIVKGGGQKTIIRPQMIINRHGLYYVQAFDFISNGFEEVTISKIDISASKTEYFTSVAPIFNSAAPATLTTTVQSLIVGLPNLNTLYLRIKYRKDDGIVTVRTITNGVIVTETDGSLYLTGYCFLRNANRTFRIDKIDKVEVLDI